MPFDHDVLANVEATLDGLSSPTPEQAYDALLQYDAPMVASAAARRALAGGGGGGSSPFTGWTGDASDPANVNSNGGNLTVPGFLTATGGVELDAADGDGEFFQSYSQDGPNYLTLGGTGNVSMAVSIMHGGGVMMAHLPTSDPAQAGHLWVDASADFALKVSQG